MCNPGAPLRCFVTHCTEAASLEGLAAQVMTGADDEDEGPPPPEVGTAAWRAQHKSPGTRRGPGN